MPNTSDGRERIAKLEAHQENTDDKLQSMDGKLEAIEEDVRAIRLKVEKSLSFVGGIILVCSLISGFLSFISVAAFDYLKMQLGIGR